MRVSEFAKGYISRLQTILNGLDVEVIEEIVTRLEETIKSGSKIYILGNGGSASTASHMVNDLGAGLRRREIINLDIVSLADNTPVCTAIANDIGYENIFYMQLKGLLKPDDVILAISCSGNSPNILKASHYANEVGATLIGITGFDGGELKRISDINLHVEAPKGEYGLVEDVHMIFDHIIYSYYIEKAGLNG